jgi:hypothetical protein
VGTALRVFLGVSVLLGLRGLDLDHRRSFLPALLQTVKTIASALVGDARGGGADGSLGLVVAATVHHLLQQAVQKGDLALQQ